VRKIALGAMILLVSSPTWATITCVQSKANSIGSRTTCAATFPTSPSANDLTVVWTTWKPSTVNVTSVTDSESNSYSNAVGPTDILISNAQQHATASSYTSPNWIMQMITLRDSRNIWSGSQSVAGPRHWIDVTAYGAKGDATTNDTAAIQSAINAACAAQIGGQNVYPIIIFPPGYYRVQQPQTPSNAPIFELPCSFLTFRGMGTSGPTATARGPQVIIQAIPGASPNSAPVFDCKFILGCAQNLTMQDLNIEGYNKALWVYKSTSIKLDNMTLFVQNTGMTDNSALMITNTFDLEWNGGTCAGIESANKYCILMTGDTSIAGEAPIVGLTYIHNLQGIGGMVRYDQRVNSTASGPGNWSFDNIRGWEDNFGPFISITNSTGNPDTVGLPTVSNITINNVSAADSGGLYPLILDTRSSTNLQGIIIDMSIAGNGGSPAIVLSGTNPQLFGCNIRSGGFTSYSAWTVVDANGNPVAGCSVTNYAGFDFLARNTGSQLGNLRSDVFPLGAPLGPPVRVTLNGNRFAGVALDPTFGAMFNDGTDFGFGASVAQSTAGTLDVFFAKNYPPTALAGTPAAGGSIPSGIYYGTVYSSSSAESCVLSAPSQQSAAVVLSGANQTINWAWTLPITGVNAVAGYCVSVSTTPNLNAGSWMPQQNNWQFVTGASTNSLSMTALPTRGGPDPLTSTLTAAHRFTPTSLGINTVKPAYNLDVLGTIHASNNVLVGAHLDSGASNSDVDGTITINGATAASQNFAIAFSVPPSCIIAPTSDPTSVGTWWVTTSSSAVTAHVHTSGTITFNYHCDGNPN
jgi:pectate lyase-like protein